LRTHRVIHPSQMDSAHKIFSPSAEEVGRAEAVLDAMAEARRGGRGAASLNGKMIDLASVRQAENPVHKAASIAAKASWFEIHDDLPRHDAWPPEE
jgi:malyl-CoA/(S)-citramalyl-CoA lyase